MIFELRVYEVASGRMSEMHDRFRKHTLPLFRKHGIDPVLFGTPEIGEMNNRLTYVVRFESLADRERAWSAFHADEEWRAVKAAIGPIDPVVTRFRSTILTPTDYSPLATSREPLA